MRWILRFRVYVIIFLAVMLISAAVIFSVLRAVLPYATDYKNEVQQEISQQVGLPVKIESIDAAIHWFSPRLRLLDVAVYNVSGETLLFDFEEAFVELDVIATILRQEVIVDGIGLIGVDISIEKKSENEWSLQGIKYTRDGSSELPEQLLYMLNNSDYLLHNSNIRFQDHTKNKLNIDLKNVNIDIENNFNNHDIRVSLNLPEQYGRDLAVVASLEGDVTSLNGTIYVEAHQLNIKQWNDKFSLFEKFQVDTIIDADIWIDLNANAIENLYTRFVSDDFSIRNNLTKEAWQASYLSSNARYVYNNGHWNFSVSDLYFGEKTHLASKNPINLLLSNDNEYYYLSADYLRFSNMQNMVDVFLNKEMLANSNQLKKYDLQSEIFNLNLKLPKNFSKEKMLDELSVDMTVSDFSIHDHENNIKLTGFDSDFHYKNKLATIDVDSENTELDFGKLFRNPIFTKKIQGEISLTYDDYWQLNSDYLQVMNTHVSTYSRLNFKFYSPDNIFTDIHTRFYDGDVMFTKYYLPVGIMSSRLVNWLDMAVTEGQVPEGDFILHGSINDFPFNNQDGVFQTLFSSEKVNMKFLEGWPLLKDVSAKLKFDKKTLEVSDAKGETQSNLLHDSAVVINDLTNPDLLISVNAESKDDGIQSYIWSSPIDDDLGDIMRLFQFKGRKDLSLEIKIPLDDDNAETQIKGSVDFINSEIFYPASGYELNDVDGELHFTNDSITANNIKAEVQGKKVIISADTRSSNLGSEVVFNIDGVFSADYLLQNHQWIPQDWLTGQSRWLIDIGVPIQEKDYLVHIEAKSDLDKVEVNLSDSVKKMLNSKLNFTGVIDVLDEEGLRIDVSVSSPQVENDFQLESIESELDASSERAVEQRALLGLYAMRGNNNAWDIDIKSDYVQGKAGLSSGLSKESVISLNLEHIDLHALFISKNKKEFSEFKPDEVPSLNVTAKKVLWNDLAFTDIKIETDWHEHGMLINKFSLHGPSMIFDSRGTWLTSWRNAQETVLEGTIKGDNLGKTLIGLGFEKSINRGVYDAEFSAKWPAEPYGLTWGNAKGESSFEMKKGQIIDVDPGSGGRLLGLLNIFKLANRLVLDFTDVTREGFSFDSIRGKFAFNNGDGNLKKFDVSASAADVTMLGEIGLLDRDYDLLMSVRPHTDSITFAGGALLGGVVLGAGLAIIQKILDFGIVVHNVYSITGHWDDPVVEKIIEKTKETEPEIDDDEF